MPSKLQITNSRCLNPCGFRHVPVDRFRIIGRLAPHQKSSQDNTMDVELTAPATDSTPCMHNDPLLSGDIRYYCLFDHQFQLSLSGATSQPSGYHEGNGTVNGCYSSLLIELSELHSFHYVDLFDFLQRIEVECIAQRFVSPTNFTS